MKYLPLIASAVLTVLATFCGCDARAQDEALIQRLLRTPLHYVVHKTSTPPTIDGRLDDSAWQNAAWTEYFGDIEGDIRPAPTYRTRVKMLWDDKYLYIGAQLEEPNVWAYVKHHDEVVFQDNDFEVFVNPDNNARHYFEIETNAIATTFDLFLPEPYKNGGSALFSWDAPGLLKAVHVDGTLNQPGDKDKGWTVELAIPIAAISMGNGPETPHPGSLWRINFSRVEWDTDIKDGKYVRKTDPASGRRLPEHNWVWSPQGVVDMHLPERWGYLVFAGEGDNTNYQLSPLELAKFKLWEVYYREHMYYDQHGAYSSDPTALPMTLAPTETLEATPHTFYARLTMDGQTWAIDPQGYIRQEKP